MRIPIKFDLLKTYKSIYGNLFIPSKFKVPVNDSRWPEEYHGYRLGSLASKLRGIRANKKFYTNELEQLKLMGFYDNYGEYMSSKFIKSLEVYKKINNNIDIPEDFVIPSNDEWPNEIHGMRLGSAMKFAKENNKYFLIKPNYLKKLLSI